MASDWFCSTICQIRRRWKEVEGRRHLTLSPFPAPFKHFTSLTSSPPFHSIRSPRFPDNPKGVGVGVSYWIFSGLWTKKLLKCSFYALSLNLFFLHCLLKWTSQSVLSWDCCPLANKDNEGGLETGKDQYFSNILPPVPTQTLANYG